MTREEITQLLEAGVFADPCSKPELIETHISWVILCDDFVYKIKKPIQYSFLDFSTINKRLFYCREEIKLNWRLTFDLYLNIIEIRKNKGKIEVGGTKGDLLDYAVRMRRLDSSMQMDKLLKKNDVTDTSIRQLGSTLARFHQKTSIVKNKYVNDIKTKFDDLLTECEYVQKELGIDAREIIENAVYQSDIFLTKHMPIMKARLNHGYYRDGHGDLHAKNIFLLQEPVIFDCIEFNEDYRQIDILNEVAFLCMDLDAVGRHDLSESFLKYYCNYHPLPISESDMNVFVYYKAYRANVRAKVNCLRSRSGGKGKDKTATLNETKKYLLLMKQYLDTLEPAVNYAKV